MNEDQFVETHLKKIFSEKKLIVDIGGGLRVDPKRNNRALENEWILPLLSKVDYKVLDKVPDYNPDIVGDVLDLPFADNSVDAILCISLLEHVEEPQKAVKEIHRVLKPGGVLYIYVPFLFYYHPAPGYYGDFYRFTVEGVRYLARDFSQVETHNAKGALATVFNLLPIFTKKTGIFRWMDRLVGKDTSDQTSGYHAICTK